MLHNPIGVTRFSLIRPALLAKMIGGINATLESNPVMRATAAFAGAFLLFCAFFHNVALLDKFRCNESNL